MRVSSADSQGPRAKRKAEGLHSPPSSWLDSLNQEVVAGRADAREAARALCSALHSGRLSGYEDALDAAMANIGHAVHEDEGLIKQLLAAREAATNNRFALEPGKRAKVAQSVEEIEPLVEEAGQPMSYYEVRSSSGRVEALSAVFAEMDQGVYTIARSGPHDAVYSNGFASCIAYIFECEDYVGMAHSATVASAEYLDEHFNKHKREFEEDGGSEPVRVTLGWSPQGWSADLREQQKRGHDIEDAFSDDLPGLKAAKALPAEATLDERWNAAIAASTRAQGEKIREWARSKGIGAVIELPHSEVLVPAQGDEINVFKTGLPTRTPLAFAAGQRVQRGSASPRNPTMRCAAAR
jgi:hypothetical protein